MKLPLLNKLKKQAHREIALLQDEVVEIMYSSFPDCKPVLHGGTAIWRCYQGNRFSEDLDFYMPPCEGFKEKLFAESSKRGLTVSKFKETENTIFAKITDGKAEVRIEINVSKAKAGEIRPAVGEFEKADGGILTILTLSPSNLLEEKMSAFENRRLIRDFYDVYHLKAIAEFDEGRLKAFASNAKKPADSKNLEALVYTGIAPSFEQMQERLLL